MKQVIKNLYLGDMHSVPQDADFVLACAAEVFQRDVPLEHQKDQFYYEDKRLLLNFEDYPEYENINQATVKLGLDELKRHMDHNEKVYVHCVYGINRSASLVFMYLVREGIITAPTYKEAQNEF
jgi:protein-tyrosine phosphatase